MWKQLSREVEAATLEGSSYIELLSDLIFCVTVSRRSSCDYHSICASCTIVMLEIWRVG